MKLPIFISRTGWVPEPADMEKSALSLWSKTKGVEPRFPCTLPLIDMHGGDDNYAHVIV